MQVNINGNDYSVSEIGYLDAIEIGQLQDKPREMAKKLILAATNIPEEVIEKLTAKQGAEVQKAINELNGLQNFQSPAEENK